MTDTLPTSVLFCCDHNSIRSPMAEGMFRHVANEEGVTVARHVVPDEGEFAQVGVITEEGAATEAVMITDDSHQYRAEGKGGEQLMIEKALHNFEGDKTRAARFIDDKRVCLRQRVRTGARYLVVDDR